MYIKKYLKNEAKWENEYQLHNEIKKFQQMRVTNQQEEDDELKEIFEKTSRNKTRTLASKTTYDDESDEDVSGVNGTKDSDDEDASSLGDKTTAAGRGRGRGRGSRGGGRGATTAAARGSRGGGRGRGAAAAAKTEPKQVTQIPATLTSNVVKRSQILNLDDSDNDILEVDDAEEDECCRGKFKGSNKYLNKSKKRTYPEKNMLIFGHT